MSIVRVVSHVMNPPDFLRPDRIKTNKEKETEKERKKEKERERERERII